MKTRKTSLIFILVFIVLAILCVTMNAANNSFSKDYSSLGMEEIADLYIRSIISGDSITVSQLVDNNLFGKMSDETPEIVWLEDAERDGLLDYLKQRKQDKEIKQILTYQKESICNVFGENAFDDYCFEFIKMNAEGADSNEYYYRADNGDRISFEEYQQLNREYWETIAKENGISVEDIYKLGNAKTDEEIKGSALYLSNVANLPAKVGIENDYEMYYVRLSFNGSNRTEDGYEEFHFVISNKSGSWRIKEGLNWNIPDDPNATDI